MYLDDMNTMTHIIRLLKVSANMNGLKNQRMAVGLNYYPMKDIVVKAEYSKRFLKSQYNNEPSFSLGIAYAGFFIK